VAAAWKLALDGGDNGVDVVLLADNQKLDIGQFLLLDHPPPHHPLPQSSIPVFFAEDELYIDVNRGETRR